VIAGLWFDLSVVWISIGLSATAAVTLFLAVRHGLPEMRPAFASAGILAAIYCGSYVWLAFNFERAREWSTLMRPVGTVSWLVTWTIPAAISMRLYRKLVAAGRKGD
jgi:hypothetical protein